jgi:hypothetical protein
MARRKVFRSYLPGSIPSFLGQFLPHVRVGLIKRRDKQVLWRVKRRREDNGGAADCRERPLGENA